MKRVAKIFGTVVGMLVFFVAAVHILLPNLWAYYFPFLRERTSSTVAYEFAVALRLNDQAAYELADPQLWSKIDDWMAGHRVRECVRIPDEQFSGGSSGGKHDVFFGCFLEEGRWYEFDVYDIQVAQEEPYLVTDWGEVKN